MEKYTIDGEKAGVFSYKRITHFEHLPDVIFNVEIINFIRDGKSIIFEFSYPPDKLDEKNMTQIKDHIVNSIKWLYKEKTDENIHSWDEQSDSVKEKINQSSKYNNESKVL